jgi:hypothetical protein
MKKMCKNVAGTYPIKSTTEHKLFKEQKLLLLV